MIYKQPIFLLKMINYFYIMNQTLRIIEIIDKKNTDTK